MSKKKGDSPPKQGYKVVAGTHSEGGVTYKKDEVVISEHPLDQLFPNKFEKVHSDRVQEYAPILVEPPTPKEESEGSEETAEVVNLPEGEDVTKDFEEASSKGFRVYKSGRGYDVYDQDDLTTPLNESPFGTKRTLNSFLKG